MESCAHEIRNDGRNDLLNDYTSRPGRPVSELRLIASQPCSNVVLGVVNNPLLVHNQSLIAPIPASFVRVPPFSLLSGFTPSPGLIAAVLLDGLDVPKPHPVAAHQMMPKLLARLALVETQDLGFELSDDVGEFPMLGFEHPQPGRGFVDDPQQHGPPGLRVGGRDPGMIPPIKIGLVPLEPIFVDLAPQLLEGARISRPDGVAGKEHFGDFTCAGCIDRLFPQ